MLILLGPLFALGQSYNPIADPAAVVRADRNARFTVLSKSMIRMEWDSAGHFTDQASFVVVNRRRPVVPFKRLFSNGWLIIRTGCVELRYLSGSGAFREDNLKVSYLPPGGRDTIRWHPGLSQQQNLKGTYRTLDGFDGDKQWGKEVSLEDGILSRDGWTLIDDSRSFLFDHSSFPWVDASAVHSRQDWYLLLYGSFYKQALAEYASIGGRVPLPPRYAFGFWWSRYWRYTDNELRDLVGRFRQLRIPLDVLVVDMDWHKDGWTGWTWDSSCFSNPAGFLRWTKTEHLKTTLNLHPADGVGPQEMQYERMGRALGFDTKERKSIPYVGSDKKFMQTLFDTILHPYEKMGVDFWWLDWQQWPEDRRVAGLSNTWWLNYVFFSQMERNGKSRPMLYHRWGGLGNHRYQIGFSGDAIISWKSLAFQPYFTNTASNVLYDYWSHDIGGHVAGEGFKGLDPELFTRWMQYGALSPIFRAHSSKNAVLNKEPWNFCGVYFDAISKAIRLRYELEPYIYTMARKTYDSAIGLCRPLYYDYPLSENAYSFRNEYLFGDDMLVAPIGAPSDSGTSRVRVWLPEGNDWYEWNTGTLLKGGSVQERVFSIDEYPLYVRAGAIVPMNADTIQDLDGQPAAVHLGVFPGAAGTGRMYEDEGNDRDYAHRYSVTSFDRREGADGSVRVHISPVAGAFAGMRRVRQYVVTFYGTVMPASVRTSGAALRYQPDGEGARWYYDGRQMAVQVYIPAVKAETGCEVVLQFGSGRRPDINGLPEKLRRLYEWCEQIKHKDASAGYPRRVGVMEELDRALEYYPERFNQLVDDFNREAGNLDPRLLR